MLRRFVLTAKGGSFCESRLLVLLFLGRAALLGAAKRRLDCWGAFESWIGEPGGTRWLAEMAMGEGLALGAGWEVRRNGGSKELWCAMQRAAHIDA